VGIAVDPARIPLDNPALQALVRANQRALLTIAEQPQLAVDYIASFLGRLTRDEVQRYYKRYIGPYFTSDGRVDLNLAQHAVDAVVTELGVAAASVDQMYSPPCHRSLEPGLGRIAGGLFDISKETQDMHPAFTGETGNHLHTVWPERKQH
jgi:hypothetical protein